MDTITKHLQEQAEKFALRFSFGVFIIETIFAAIVFSGNQTIGITGHNSLSDAILVPMAVVPLVTVFFGYRERVNIVKKLLKTKFDSKVIFNGILISVSYSIILFIINLGILYLLEFSFKGTALTSLITTIGVGVYCSIVSYAVAQQSFTVKRKELVRFLLIFMTGGLVLSMLSASNSQWWMYSLSYLGHDIDSGLIFNFSMILVGLLGLALSLTIIEEFKVLQDLKHIKRYEFNYFKFLMLSLSTCILVIGLFPSAINSFSNFVHNLSAYFLAGIMIFGSISITFVMKIYSSDFRRSSVGIGMLIVLSILSYILAVVSFVTMEIFLFILTGIWVLQMYNNTEIVIDNLMKDKNYIL